MTLRSTFAFFGIALAFAACGGTTSLGTGNGELGNGGAGAGGGGSGGSQSGGSAGAGGQGGWDACAGRPCGAPCMLCAPSDPACTETAIEKYCDEKGECGMNFPVCGPSPTCTSDADCPQVGAPCQACPDGSYACPTTACENGQCVGSFPGCTGGECASAKDCPQPGAPCVQCPDGTLACPSVDCIGGKCVGSNQSCAGWDACSGKACGEVCSLCPPDDPSCLGPAVVTYCDQSGQCGMNFPDCSGGGECTSDAECPQIDACPACPNGECAAYVCDAGKCQLECPPSKDPACASDADCPHDEICKICPDATCAAMTCLAGACEWVCPL
jgi:hypothetical protein